MDVRCALNHLHPDPRLPRFCIASALLDLEISSSALAQLEKAAGSSRPFHFDGHADRQTGGCRPASSVNKVKWNGYIHDMIERDTARLAEMIVPPPQATTRRSATCKPASGLRPRKRYEMRRAVCIRVLGILHVESMQANSITGTACQPWSR